VAAAPGQSIKKTTRGELDCIEIFLQHRSVGWSSAGCQGKATSLSPRTTKQLTAQSTRSEENPISMAYATGPRFRFIVNVFDGHKCSI